MAARWVRNLPMDLKKRLIKHLDKKSTGTINNVDHHDFMTNLHEDAAGHHLGEVHDTIRDLEYNQIHDPKRLLHHYNLASQHAEHADRHQEKLNDAFDKGERSQKRWRGGTTNIKIKRYKTKR